MNDVKPAPDEQELVKKTWGMLAASAMAALAIKFGLDAIAELDPGDQDAATIAIWIAAVGAAVPAAIAGWRRRHGRPAPSGHTTNVMKAIGGFAILISAVFLSLSTSIQAVLLGAGGGFFAGLVLGVMPGVVPAWIRKWRRDFG